MNPHPCRPYGFLCAVFAAALLCPLSAPLAAAPGDCSPDGVFCEVDPASIGRFPDPPTEFTAYKVDLQQLAQILQGAPPETFPPRPPGSTTMIYPPDPGGTFFESAVYNSPLLSSRMTAQYPQIQTYVFRGTQAQMTSGRLYQDGKVMQIFARAQDGTIRFHPVETTNGTFYISYFDRHRTDGANKFGHPEDEHQQPPTPLAPMMTGQTTGGPSKPSAPNIQMIETGPELTIYDLAMVATGEYTLGRDTSNPGVYDDVVESMVQEVNNLNGFLEAEVAIRLNFVAVWLFDDPDTDPYVGNCDVGGSDTCVDGPDKDAACASNNDCRPAPCVLRDGNPAVYDAVFTMNGIDYDIGFTFGSGSGFGCAWYVVCKPDRSRGAGNVNLSWSIGSAAGVMAHEMGHQLDARHTFSGLIGGCTALEFNANAAYEPGSGSSIMSYLGSCSDGMGNSDNVDTTDPDNGFYYANRSFVQISDNTQNGTGNTCGVKVNSGNNAPNVDAGIDYQIPQSTPFMLTGSVNDPDGDPTINTWEQNDQAPDQRNIDTDPDGLGPIFRSVPPTASLSRTFPKWSDILNNTQTPGEILPFKDRNMSFRLTARDQRMGGGGTAYDTMNITVEGDPFFVISPDGGETLGTDCTVPAMWEPGGSIATEVSIRLSKDDGQSFPDGLVFGATNDGSTPMTLPCGATTEARILISGDDNIFFDVSNGPFTIEQVAPTSQLNTNGGSVDDACEFVIPIDTVSEDDCRIGVAGVDADATLLTGNATLGPLNFNKVPNGIDEVDGTGSVLVSDLTSCPAIVRIELESEDGCGDLTTEFEDVQVIDDTPPTLQNVPPDMVVECDMVPPPAPVTAEDNCDADPDLTFGENVIPGSCAGNYTLERTWEAFDECGGMVSHTQTIMVQDTTPPVVTETDEDLYCLWPPNHRVVCFGQEDFDPEITDNCSEPITWVFQDCAAVQPVDGPMGGWNGDGSTTPDCIISPDQLSFCVRSERAGAGPTPADAQEGRRYELRIVATDDCGNSSDPMKIGNVYVPHDQNPKLDTCIKTVGMP